MPVRDPQTEAIRTVKRWPRKRSRGGVLGLGAAAVLFCAGAAALAALLRAPFGLWPLFGLLVGGALAGCGGALATIALGYYRLGYVLSADRLIIRWSGPSETILLDEIDGIYAGQRLGRIHRVRGINWPGYYVGTVRSRTMGALQVFCSDLSVDALSIVTTPDRCYVLSPADPPAFRRELIQRIQNAPERAAADLESSEARRGWSWGLPRPLVAGLATAAAVLLMASFAAVAQHYEALPATLTLAGRLTGGVEAAAPKTELYAFPLLGAVVLGLNLVLSAVLQRWERSAPVLLCATAYVVEAVVLLATLRAIADAL